MEYKNKYLKYKTKFLDLKNQSGGADLPASADSDYTINGNTLTINNDEGMRLVKENMMDKHEIVTVEIKKKVTNMVIQTYLKNFIINLT